MGTLYTNATDALPTMSINGMQYFFVAYYYDTNFIFALPIANVKYSTLVEAFDTIFTELTEKEHKSTFNVIDNQAFNPLKKYLQSKNLPMAICGTNESTSQHSRTCYPNV